VALHPDFYDAELRWHNEHFRAAADVGCGTGQSTRQAARAAVDGSALGADLSAPMLERARQLSDDEGLGNVSYRQADAETYPFPSARFDLCISRFGTMFFADPVAAFAVTQGILTAAGFTEVHEPVFYGPDITTAYDAVLSLGQAKHLLADLDAATTAHALQRLRASLAAHDTGNAVLFDSRAWIVTAIKQRPGGPAGA